jgi:transposase InsO family protein
MCALAQVSRVGYYRWLRPTEPDVDQMELRSTIQKIFLQHRRRYGYRRVTGDLQDLGFHVNRKRVQRMMREDNLIAVQPAAFVSTTDSKHKLEVYLNVAARLELTGVNQLWVADITYIRLGNEFVYLAVVLDAYSRKVVGWELARTLTSTLATAALQKAIASRRPLPGLVHHSDRGIQYACHEYTVLLEQYQIVPSMSRPANPYDNATCESFIRTLKREEINASNYCDLGELRQHIEEFIDGYYNRLRLHSALGYRSPEAFERQCSFTSSVEAAKMSFFRHEEIFQSDIKAQSGEPACGRSPAHRPDESPAGYSSVGCSPAEPASASPAVTEPEP